MKNNFASTAFRSAPMSKSITRARSSDYVRTHHISVRKFLVRFYAKYRRSFRRGNHASIYQRTNHSGLKKSSLRLASAH